MYWEAIDVLRMAHVVGPDVAATRRTPYLPSILKLAKARGVALSPKLERQLEFERDVRRNARRLAALDDAPPRTAMERKYFPHQRADLERLRNTTSVEAWLIAHQPTVGKTLEAIRYAVDQLGLLNGRVLIIAKNSAKEQWADEVVRWSSVDRPRIVEGTIVQQLEILSTCERWCITHWESLVHARAGLLAAPWDLVIADEVHLAGNREAQRSATLHALGRRARYRLALSGTPWSNHVGELFSVLKFLYPYRYKSYWRFVNMHATLDPKPFGGIEVGPARRPNLLRWEIAPFTLRRTIAEVRPNLPLIRRLKRTAELTTRGEREYGRIKKRFFAELEAEFGTKTIPIINVLARTTRLRQYLIDPGLLGAKEPSVKYPIVRELLEELDAPPVIFTMFRQAGDRLRAYLHTHGYRNVGFLHGSMRSGEARQLTQRFVRGRFDALIVGIQAGAESLNLGGYGYGIYLDLPWTPKDVEQTEGRFNRPVEGTGVVVPATAWRIIVKGSYEERVMEQRIDAKHVSFGTVFTVSELRGLFA